MFTPLQQSYQEWKLLWKKSLGDTQFFLSLFKGAILLTAAFIVETLANTYASIHASAPVADVILSNIPAHNVFWYYAYGPIIFTSILLVICLRWPSKLPFVIKSLAIFYFIRSAFVCLTHLGIPPGQIVGPGASPAIRRYFLGGDFFFSGHVGMPILMTCIFWGHVWVRRFLVVASIFFAIVVLWGHYHYSIDVAGAILITPSIFAIARWLFPEDYTRSLTA